MVASEIELAKRLFHAGGALSPDDPAFEETVFVGPSYSDPEFGAANFEPQVIASPKGSGKTTLSHVVLEKHQDYAFKKKVEHITCEIPERRKKYSEEELRSHMARLLRSTKSGTLPLVLSSSRLLRSQDIRFVLTVRRAEALSQSAMRWLLYGVRELVEDPKLTARLQIQVVVDGSFAVQTLTAGPDSDFPIQQVYPREFESHEQQKFMLSRFRKLHVAINRPAVNELWSMTWGDKYFTQKICLLLADRVISEGISCIDTDLVRNVIEEYLSTSARGDHEKGIMIRALVSLARVLMQPDGDPTSFWSGIDDEWDTMSKELRSVAYEGGLVRRTGEYEVKVRAPIVVQLGMRAEKRIHHVRSLLRTRFAIRGIPSEDHLEAEDLIRRIEEAAALGFINSLHIGIGIRKDHYSVELEAFALNHGSYQGNWTIDLGNRVPIGGSVWCILWSWEEEWGKSKSELYTYQVIPYE